MNDKKRKEQGIISYRRAPIEIESPEEQGYERIKYNLTESSVTDMIYVDLDVRLKDLTLAYTDHRGYPSLRERIAAGTNVTQENVLITAGAASALFIVATSLLKPRDHVVVLHPNYVTNIETPRAIGCRSEYIALSFEEDFRIDIARLEQLIKPETRLVSLTYPHNPTGAMITESQLKEIVSLVEAHDCYLLFDETYREMVFGKPLPVAASLSPHVISVSSFSKSYGLPGIRIGWLITQDKALMETFLAAKEQIFICNSIVDETIAHQFLVKKEQFFPQILDHISTNFEIMKTWMKNNEFFEWVEPSGGCLCFPRIKSHLSIDIPQFYTHLNEKYGTFVGPGHWFEMDDRYMRIGYGWPSRDDLEGGLHCITKVAETVLGHNHQ